MGKPRKILLSPRIDSRCHTNVPRYPVRREFYENDAKAWESLENILEEVACVAGPNLSCQQLQWFVWGNTERQGSLTVSKRVVNFHKDLEVSQTPAKIVVKVYEESKTGTLTFKNGVKKTLHLKMDEVDLTTLAHAQDNTKNPHALDLLLATGAKDSHLTPLQATVAQAFYTVVKTATSEVITH